MRRLSQSSVFLPRYPHHPLEGAQTKSTSKILGRVMSLVLDLDICEIKTQN